MTLQNAVIIGLLILLALSVGAHALDRNKLAKQLVAAQNAAALKDKTIEEQKGLYEKLSLQESNVEGSLTDSNAQVNELKKELGDTKEQLASAVQLSLQIKQQQATVAGNQSTVAPAKTGEPERVKVAFSKDFGSVVVNGFTLTNPGEADLTLAAGQPLKLTVALAQDSTKAWHAYATSSDPNIGVNIDLASVDPYLDAPKWYEKIGVLGDLAVGSTANGAGILAGAGLSYQFGKVEVGPKVFVDISNHVDMYYGAGVVWHPFERN